MLRSRTTKRETEVDESDLAEIESRILEYPVQARRDILRLMSELRGLRGPSKPPGPGSPLYDSVTGLLNGGAYGVRFAGAMARAARYQKIFAVMSIDLALSKEKPAPSEHDRALKLVAERLEQCVRAADTLARIDDEKFVIILEDLSANGQVDGITEKVQRALSGPVSVGEREMYPDATISVQIYPTPENAVAPSPLDRRLISG